MKTRFVNKLDKTIELGLQFLHTLTFRYQSVRVNDKDQLKCAFSRVEKMYFRLNFIRINWNIYSRWILLHPKAFPQLNEMK